MKTFVLFLGLAFAAFGQCGPEHAVVQYDSEENSVAIRAPDPYCNGAVVVVYYNAYPEFLLTQYPPDTIILVYLGEYVPYGHAILDFWCWGPTGVPIFLESYDLAFP